ncbi:MAG: hypothetical protein GXY56_02495 [Clostridiales bacterium]|jgi:DNA-binding SARP family transcriptional activator|nr:hypothetical protein [Clostridiales bacterium]
MLQINVLGKTKISCNGELLDKQLSTKAQALVYLLIAHNGKFISRDKIMAYLWPDSTTDAARYNLRYNLWQLKKLLPHDGADRSLVLSEKDGCSIDSRYSFQCDLLKIQACSVHSRDLEELAHTKGLFCGDFMEGWYLKNCNEFNEMILFERMNCERIQVELLKALARRYEESGRLEDALTTWKEMAQVDMDNEETAYNIVRLYYEMGNRVAAINHYKKFETGLWDNLNIAPNEELQRLHRDLISGSDSLHSTKKAIQVQTRSTLEINGHCIKNIDYFLISDVISALLRFVDKGFLADFEKDYVRDLSVIQRDLLICYEKTTGQPLEAVAAATEGHVPAVRIVQAFCKLIEYLTDRYDIRLRISNREHIDEVSAQIIEYLETSGISGFSLE